MFNEEDAPYFKDLPLAEQKKIITVNNYRIEWEKERQKEREYLIEQKCNHRGYGLDPTRGCMSFPSRSKSRRCVGDFTILESD